MRTKQFTLKVAVSQTAHFVRFVAERFPAFYALFALSMLALVLEYLTMSLMIPLASPESSSSAVVGFWFYVADHMGLEPSMRMWVWLFFVFMGIRLFLGYGQTVATTMLGKAVHRSLSERVFKHVVAVEPLSQIYMRSIGHYITLAGDDTFRCGTIVSNLLQAWVGMLTAMVAMVVLYQFSAIYFVYLTLFLALCGLCIGVMLRRLVRLVISSNQLSRELNTAFVESMNALRSIRALAGEYLVTMSYADQISRYTRQLVKIESLKSAMRSFPAIVLLLTAVWLTRPGANLNEGGASLFSATVIVIRVFAALGQVVAAGMLLVTDMRALHDIDGVIGLSEESMIAPATKGREDDRTRIRSIQLKGIEFAYPKHPPIFQDADFVFRAGRTYAIIGPSGTGKSTLADLLLGLVEPKRGERCVNDESEGFRALGDKVLLVEQQPRIFSTSVRDNLLFGVTASDKDLWDVLELVDLADLIRSMPQGLDTAITYQGENLSGGQRQRIGVARALLRHPDVLVLDEATSALDVATREVLLANVSKRLRDGILIYITHDPTITCRADEVVDLGQAKIRGAVDVE